MAYCIALYNNKRYSSLSNGEKHKTNMEIVKTLQNYYGVNIPIIEDDCESITIPYETDRQIVELYASIPEDKKELEFVKLNANKIKGE